MPLIDQTTSGLSSIDHVVVVVYMVFIVGLGVIASRKGKCTSGDYFLAGRSLRWPMIGAALFATNISTVHLVGLASAGYSDGLVFGNFEWLAAFCLILLGLVFAPFYFRNRIATLPEYLEKRFGGGARTCLAFMAVVGALFIHIGVSLYAGAAIFEEFFGIKKFTSIAFISIATTIYTVIGGLMSVVVTEAVQTVLLLIGACIITVAGINALHDRGIEDFASFRLAVDRQAMLVAGDDAQSSPQDITEVSTGDAASAPMLEIEDSGRLSMLHADGPFAWYAMLLGYPVLGIWYWCADQTIVQRVLGAREEQDARLGPIFAGFIKILPVFLMVFPGVMAFVLFRDKIGSGPGDADRALPVLIMELVPNGLRGLVAAGLLAALMSTIAGALNSTSTLVSIDIVKRIRPNTPDRSLITIGRVTAVIVMICAMAWSTQGNKFGGIFAGLNQMIACLAPPITAVFLGGVFWRRGTNAAALATLIGGFLLGAAVFVLDFPAFGFEYVTKELGIPFMLQAWWLFVICTFVFFFVSMVTSPQRPEQIDGLCWKNPISVLTVTQAGLLDVRLWSALLTIVMICLYFIFG